MVYSAILFASIFLVLAFAIERLGRFLRVPSVIVMIVTGLVAKPLLGARGVELAGLEVVVPILGAIGLILIVLEGALDIELRRDRIRTAAGAITIAVAGFFFLVLFFGSIALLALGLSPFHAALLAVPFAVISSAVAIPSSDFLPPRSREFVIYESSVSDILGVLVFFALLNSTGTLASVAAGLIGGGVLSLLLSIVCAVGLMLVLVRIDGHIRFIPLLAGLFGLYALGEILHLSPLIMVLLFGLALNNPTLITRFRPLRNWVDDRYEETLVGFKGLVLELTFAVRGFFFLLLGYWTELSTLAAPEAWAAAVLVLVTIYVSRHFMLKASGHKRGAALTWFAPRGLITVLLFLSVKEALELPRYLDGTVVLVLLASSALIAVARFRLTKEDAEAARAAADEKAKEKDRAEESDEGAAQAPEPGNAPQGKPPAA
ncbi:MAG: cation:proton antiporter [Burkholderiales bacterium]